MKFTNLKSFLFVGIISINSLALSADNPAHNAFINDTILNKSDKKINVQVQFTKFLNMDHPGNQQDLIKYAAQTQIAQSVKYDLEPNKEVKIYEEFIKSNPLKHNEYWMPSDVTVDENGLNIYIDVKTSNIGDELVSSKKYIVSILNNGLKVETENTLR